MLLEDGASPGSCRGVAGFSLLLEVKEGELKGELVMTMNFLSKGGIESVCLAGLNICQDYPATLDEKQNETPHKSFKHPVCTICIWNTFPAPRPLGWRRPIPNQNA